MREQQKTIIFILVFLVVILDGVIWFTITASTKNDTASARDYFLDVGQGDSELIVLPGNIKVMTDAGPDDSVLKSLAKAMPPNDSYIDIAIISHPQLDHFNGYNFILDHYRIGAFIYNGRDDSFGITAWTNLKAKIAAKHIPFLTLGAGDRILAPAASSEIDMVSPTPDFAHSVELNDTGFIELIKNPAFRTLLTADIGDNVEEWLLAQGSDVRADVLKVPHHGSKYASDGAFLRAVNPAIAVIEVGAHNTYGHPASSTLAELASSTRATIFRTDRDGTIEVYMQDGKLVAKKE
jgi:competence protein ComEC